MIPPNLAVLQMMIAGVPKQMELIKLVSTTEIKVIA